jgi:hypothetical protein
MNNTIYTLIPKVMDEIGAIGKDRKNIQQNYQFRGIDDLYNAVHSALARHGVFCVPTVIDQKREERPSKSGGVLIYTVLTIKYTFYAPDGSFFDAVVIGEGMDSGDKSGNKAMSGAQKYALLQVFCIPTEEPKDSENESPEVKPIAMTAEELVDKMTTSNNLFELKNRYAKYAEQIGKLSGEDKVKVTMAKDRRKTELQEADKQKKEGA